MDRLTRTKANRNGRLLLVDGHSSHYTVEFLQYARENNMHILCYPSHTTHVFQGLDVACFSPLKRNYREELRTFNDLAGRPIRKEDFLHLYAKAHVRTFTVETIKSAFAATGVFPFNPNVIEASALQPSLATSIRPNALPLHHVQTTPMRAVSRLLELASSDGLPPFNPEGARAKPSSDTEALGFLLDLQKSTAKSEDRLQASPLNLPPPIPSLAQKLRELNIAEGQHGLTNNEQKELLDIVSHQSRTITMLTSTLVLRDTYMKKLQQQVQAKEKKKRTGNTRLLGDGLPKVLSGDEFFERAKEHQQRRKAEEEKKILARSIRKKNAEHVQAFKEATEERKALVQARRLAFAEEKRQWEGRKALAKAERRSFTEPKPKLGLNLIPKAPSRPKVSDLYSLEHENGEFFDLDDISKEEYGEAEYLVDESQLASMYD